MGGAPWRGAAEIDARGGIRMRCDMSSQIFRDQVPECDVHTSKSTDLGDRVPGGRVSMRPKVGPFDDGDRDS